MVSEKRLIQDEKMAAKSFTASVDLLNMLLKYASDIGISEQTVSSACGTDLSTYRFTKARLPMQVFNKIWLAVINCAEDPNFGLNFGEASHHMLRQHLLYAMMANCDTVQQAIQKKFQYHNLIMDLIQPAMIVTEHQAKLIWQVGHPALKVERHLTESVMALFVCMLRYLSNNEITLTEVHFCHSAPASLVEHERIFQAPLSFAGFENAMVLPKNYLSAPILFSNPAIMQELENLVQKILHQSYGLYPWKQKVSHLLFESFLKQNPFDIETIAGQLALTKRTLQLKLKQENTSFRELLDEVRRELAKGFLKDGDNSLCEIALLLGFAEQSAFQHAFKRWTGLTPGDYRKSLSGIKRTHGR